MTPGCSYSRPSRFYEQLRNQVLRRDSWRCQSCGTMSNFEVHHKEFRSQSGDDSEQNWLRFVLHATPQCITAERRDEIAD